MDELTKLERDFADANFQIDAISRLLDTLKTTRENIYDQIQDAIAQRPVSPPIPEKSPQGAGLLITCDKCDGTGKLETVEWK